MAVPNTAAARTTTPITMAGVSQRGRWAPRGAMACGAAARGCGPAPASDCVGVVMNSVGASGTRSMICVEPASNPGAV